ncbi:MAG: class I SAM-dependent methyltransferase [Gammaproteobacteria bacterium]|nr:class I SAM-dependent methyltransferase [Rhodocyclaceae bacterium]MBU3907749.1 class I SAM-dependent methyltransferase [Gammaproteobacteria bacterium]MBU3989819.1 class I SAM-dependent methyltransferase [Gammaproteobacteria bacterium]MBU4004395.1 class I SAM-dependent methyltransferase [Gammaproteobacteria bacterium]MBU4019804.1 class I SAM-dependent methyltransferase [Gammaproteobacteria bacterium]
MPSNSPFDESAKTWDQDPVKLARAQAVADGIRSQVPPQARALDYGCGTGLLGFALQAHCGHISLADSSAGMLAVLDEKIAASGATNLRSTRLDLVTDPLPPDRYELICTLMTAHHIADTDKLLRDLHALLAASGYLCIADLDAEDGSFHGPEFDGHKGFGRDELQHQAEAAGFRDVSFTTVFHMQKGAGPQQTEFPIFLMIARKPSQ